MPENSPSTRRIPAPRRLTEGTNVWKGLRLPVRQNTTNARRNRIRRMRAERARKPWRRRPGRSKNPCGPRKPLLRKRRPPVSKEENRTHPEKLRLKFLLRFFPRRTGNRPDRTPLAHLRWRGRRNRRPVRRAEVRRRKEFRGAEARRRAGIGSRAREKPNSSSTCLKGYPRSTRFLHDSLAR